MDTVLIVLAMLLLLATGLWSFLGKLTEVVQWTRSARPSPVKRLLSAALPLALVLFLLPGVVHRFLLHLPARQEELFTISAPLDTIHQYRHAYSNRGLHPYYYTYTLSLRGQPEPIHLPSYQLSFDQEAFLVWAGDETLSVRCANMGGAIVAYEVARPDGDLYLTCAQTAASLTLKAWRDLLFALWLLLLGAELLLDLPRRFSRGSGRERAALGFLLVVLLGGGWFFHLYRGSPPPVDTAAYSRIPLALGDQIQLELPVGWTQKDSPRGYSWYQGADGAACRFMVEDWLAVTGVSEAEQQALTLRDYRARLLDDFICQPWRERGPFLSLLETFHRTDGTDLTFAQGFGLSQGDRKNHFLLLFLPQQQLLVIQTSAYSRTSWEQLGNYVDAQVFPLLNSVVVPTAR